MAVEVFYNSHKRLNLHNFAKQSLELVSIGIVINVVTGGFRQEGLKWLAHVTVQLQLSDNSRLSNYSFAD